jgi:hypothetical protein
MIQVLKKISIANSVLIGMWINLQVGAVEGQLSTPYLILRSSIHFSCNRGSCANLNCDQLFTSTFDALLSQIFGSYLENFNSATIYCNAITVEDQPLSYELKLTPKNQRDMNNLTYDMKQIIRINQTFMSLLVSEQNLNNQSVSIDFNSFFNSIKILLGALNSNTRCDLLKCDMKNYKPVCEKSLTDSFECVHLCDSGAYCQNNGICVISYSLDALCL